MLIRVSSATRIQLSCTGQLVSSSSGAASSWIDDVSPLEEDIADGADGFDCVIDDADADAAKGLCTVVVQDDDDDDDSNDADPAPSAPDSAVTRATSKPSSTPETAAISFKINASVALEAVARYDTVRRAVILIVFSPSLPRVCDV
jgi:hypothetical protein